MSTSNATGLPERIAPRFRVNVRRRKPPPPPAPPPLDRMDAFALIRAWRDARFECNQDLAERILGHLRALTHRQPGPAWSFDAREGER
jgi:hypothetical protein